jgi:hypothetical protein
MQLHYHLSNGAIVVADVTFVTSVDMAHAHLIDVLSANPHGWITVTDAREGNTVMIFMAHLQRIEFVPSDLERKRDAGR